MIRAERSVVIDRTAEKVFAFEPQRPIELGSRITWLINFMGQSEYASEATAFERGRRIEFTTREGRLTPPLTHTFEDVSGQTRYTRRVEIPLQGMFRLIGPVMQASGAARRRNARFTPNLKGLLEG